MAVLLIAAASITAYGAEPQSSARLVWRPVRPAHQSASDAQEREARQARSALADRQPAPQPRRAFRRDDKVVRVVMQQDADPLSNPFAEPMPRSPFQSGRPGPAPAAEGDASAPSVLSEANQPSDASAREPSGAGSQGSSTEPGRLSDPSGSNAAADSRLDLLRQEPYLPEETQALDPKEACEAALRRYRANMLTGPTGRRILDLTLPRNEEGQVADPPYECNLSERTFAIDTGREWAQTLYTWKASGLCHKPLYFEQSHMERYGHSFGPVLDPVISGAHFFASVPVLPYKMGLEPPCECIYPLGHYRPGNCAPRYIEPFPWSLRAAGTQAAVTTGLIFALP